MPRLNDDAIRKIPLAPAGQRYRLPTDVSGLALEVGSKSKRWFVQADQPRRVAPWGKFRGRTLRRVIGRWDPDRGDHVSAKAARTRALLFLAQIKDGVDPNAPQRAASGPTLRDALASHLATLTRTGRSPRTADAYRGTITRFCADWLDRPLADLATDRGRADFRERFEKVSLDNGPVVANLLARSVRAVYGAQRRSTLSLPPDGPTAGLQLNPERTRADQGLTLAQLPAWWAAAKKLPLSKRAFGLLGLLCGARPWIELVTVRWSDVSVRRRTIRFSRPKGWRPDRDNSFELPITKPMMRALAMARAAGPRGGFVFKFVKGPQPDMPAWGHALRHTFASIAEEIGFGEADYGPLLNHSPRSVTGRYPNRRGIRHTRGREVLEAVDAAIVGALTKDPAEGRMLGANPDNCR